jgi:hypothetical protein
MKRLIIPIVLLGVFSVAFSVEARTPLYIDAEADVSVACTMQYEPVCGAKEVQCIKAPCHPVYQTYGNSCVLGVEGATYVHAGECTAADTGPLPGGGSTYTPPAHCVAWFDGCNQCGRGPDGESFCTLKACIDAPSAGYCTKYADQPEPAPQPTHSPSPEVTSTTTVEADASVEVPGFFASLWVKIASLFDFF